MKKMNKRIILEMGVACAMVFSLMILPFNHVYAATEEPIQDKNVVYLNGNDAIITKDPDNSDGAIVKSGNSTFKVAWSTKNGEESYVYAGGVTGQFDTVNIEMQGGKVNYILGGNKQSGVVNTANIVMNGGYVGIIHGSSRSTTATTLNDCTLNTTNNVNITMNNGEAQALVPGSFNLTYVKNASVTLNGGRVAATTAPVQSGILGGTNGKTDNLTIHVNGGSTKDIALAQRTMINKASIEVKGGSVGNIYAGSYYDDGDNAIGTDNWKGWGVGDVNYGQAKEINIQVSGTAKYNDIYAGFQFLDKDTFISKYGNYNYGGTANIAGSENTIAKLYLEVDPDKKTTNKEKHTVSMIDSKYAITNWKTHSVQLDQSSVEMKVGQILNLKATVTPIKAEAVELSSANTKVAVVQNGKIIAVGEGTTTITARSGDKSAVCQITVKKVAVQVPDVDSSKPTNELSVNVTDQSSQKVISKTVSEIVSNIIAGHPTTAVDEETIKKVQESVLAGKVITTAIQVDMLQPSEVDQTLIKNVQKYLNKDAQKLGTEMKISQYLDLRIALLANGLEIGHINELSDNVSFNIHLPAQLRVEGRKFYVVRVHNGTIELLNTKISDDGILSFETDRFSTYALAYVDKKTVSDTTQQGTNSNHVQTADKSNIVNLLVVAGLALSAGCIIILDKKRKELLNK